LAQSLLQPSPRLLQVERLEERALFVGQLAARRRLLEPVEQLLGDLQRFDLDAVEVGGEGGVEGGEGLLAMDAEGAGDVVEAVERGFVEVASQRLGDGERFLGADFDAAATELVEEVDEHRGKNTAAGEKFEGYGIRT